MSSFENVPARDWEDWVAVTEATIIDIREPAEWELGTLPGARLISMGEIPQRMDEFDKDAPLLLVCRSGSRSHQVAVYLAMSGYSRVANMTGGMKALGMQD
ncbi:MAG: rhodanese-like domain-containing protein [Acidimicrobiia bacterium]